MRVCVHAQTSAEVKVLNGLWDETRLSARHRENLFCSIRYQEAEIIFFIFYNGTGMRPNLISGVVACCSYRNVHPDANDSGKVAWRWHSSHLCVTPPLCIPSCFFFPPSSVHPPNWLTSCTGARVFSSSRRRPFKSSTMDARRRDAVAISRRK